MEIMIDGTMFPVLQGIAPAAAIAAGIALKIGGKVLTKRAKSPDSHADEADTGGPALGRAADQGGGGTGGAGAMLAKNKSDDYASRAVRHGKNRK